MYVLHRPKGFTLVETLVAITILTLAVIAPFQAIQNVVSASRLAKEKLIAASLAQEALEYVRFVRDNNYLANPSTYTALDGMNGTGGPNCTATNGCTLDATVAPSSAFAACGSTCNVLQLDPTSGFYTQANVNNPTIYTRKINLTQTNGSGYETVTVTITWTDHGSNSMILSENLYDWL